MTKGGAGTMAATCNGKSTLDNGEDIQGEVVKDDEERDMEKLSAKLKEQQNVKWVPPHGLAR